MSALPVPSSMKDLSQMTDNLSEIIGIALGSLQLVAFGWGRAAAARARRRWGARDGEAPVKATSIPGMPPMMPPPPGSVVHYRWADGSSATVWMPGAEGARWS
ncbi:hypothetical protein GCM10022420_070860 [Streptomyces iranensis]